MSKAHITLQETKAAIYAVQSFAQPGDRVRLGSDATTAVAALNKWGSNRSKAVNQELKKFRRWTEQNQVEVSAHHVQGESNPADEPSRPKYNRNDWFLNRTVWSKAMRALRRKPSIDLFATKQHRHCLRYLSRDPQPLAVGTDSLSQTWSEWPDAVLYVNPPWPLISVLLAKIVPSMRADQTLLLVTPVWETEPWWGLVRRYSKAPPLLLPQIHGLYTNVNTTPFRPPRWSSVLWTLGPVKVKRNWSWRKPETWFRPL